MDGERKIKTFLRTRPIEDAHHGYDFPSETHVTVPVPHHGKEEVVIVTHSRTLTTLVACLGARRPQREPCSVSVCL